MMHYDTFYLILDSLILIIIYYLLLKGLGLLCKLLCCFIVWMVYFLILSVIYFSMITCRSNNFPSFYNTITRKGIRILKITDQMLLQHWHVLVTLKMFFSQSLYPPQKHRNWPQYHILVKIRISHHYLKSWYKLIWKLSDIQKVELQSSLCFHWVSLLADRFSTCTVGEAAAES